MQRLICRRAYSTFVPPSSLRSVTPLPRKPLPESPSFYAGNFTYHDNLVALEKAYTISERALRASHVLPLTSVMREKLPETRPLWKKIDEIQTVVESKLKTGQYRRVLKLLGDLHEMRLVAQTSGNVEVEEQLNRLLEPFQREDPADIALKESGMADVQLSDGSPTKKLKVDAYGRSYALGRRKESSARVWIIPVQSTSPAPADSQLSNTLDTLVSTEAPASTAPPSPTVSSILINNLPIATFFSSVSDRERIMRPFQLTGTLGAYNVFAIARGGGTSGQAGAVTHGISKALAAQRPDLKKILTKAQLIRRDPRMVERKKTGMPKARKRYAWVKR